MHVLYDRPSKRRQLDFDCNYEFGEGVLLADAIVNKFGVEETAVQLIDRWETDIIKMSRRGISTKEWSDYFYLLYVFCESNVVTPESITCDSGREFSNVMELWLLHAVNNGKIPIQTNSLVSLLMSKLNLDNACRKDLRLLEIGLLKDIEIGEPMLDLLEKVKVFCRRWSGPGFYDQKGQLTNLFGKWYESTVNSYFTDDLDEGPLLSFLDA